MTKIKGLPRSFDGWDPVHRNNWYTIWKKDNYEVMAATSGAGAASVFAVDKSGRVVLNHIYRTPIDRYSIEIPRGGIDAGEEPRIAAARELKEETGIKVDPDQLYKLTEFFPDGGIMAHVAHLYAVDLDFDVIDLQPEDVEEVSEHKVIPLEDLREKILKGEVMDSFTIVAERLYALKKEEEGMQQVIEILDENQNVITNIVTDRPKWSFDQYCRNRETVGWSWRIARMEGIGTPAA